MEQSKPEKHYVISYSHKDQDIARQLKEDLKKRGFEIWMDNSNIMAESREDDPIVQNIQHSVAVLYLVSPTSRASRYVDHQIGLAKIYRKNIIPLWVRGDTEWAKVVTFDLFSTRYIDLR